MGDFLDGRVGGSRLRLAATRITSSLAIDRKDARVAEEDRSTYFFTPLLIDTAKTRSRPLIGGGRIGGTDARGRAENFAQTRHIFPGNLGFKDVQTAGDARVGSPFHRLERVVTSLPPSAYAAMLAPKPGTGPAHGTRGATWRTRARCRRITTFASTGSLAEPAACALRSSLANTQYRFFRATCSPMKVRSTRWLRWAFASCRW